MKEISRQTNIEGKYINLSLSDVLVLTEKVIGITREISSDINNVSVCRLNLLNDLQINIPNTPNTTTNSNMSTSEFSDGGRKSLPTILRKFENYFPGFRSNIPSA